MLGLKRVFVLISAITLSCCFVNLSLGAELLPSHGQSASKMTAAANAFIATLDADQRESTVLPLLVDERTTWSNLPIIMVSPKGILVEPHDARGLGIALAGASLPGISPVHGGSN